MSPPPRPGRSLTLLPLAALAAAVLLLVFAAQRSPPERSVCNCDAAIAAAQAQQSRPAAPLAAAAAEGDGGGGAGSAEVLASLAKLAALRVELAEAKAALDKLSRKHEAEAAEARATIRTLSAPSAAFKPLTKEQRVVQVLDAIDPKLLWRPGNRAWSMSQTVRNHNVDARRCGTMGSDKTFGAPKALPAAHNATLRALPLDKLYDPIASVAAHDEMEALKCDVGLPSAPLPPFTLAHKHTHHLSRYTMYFNIMCWLESEPRFGRVLDVSGSEPWLTRFDPKRTEVVAVNYPKTDIHDLSSFPPNSFDWVMADQVMEHLRFPQQAMDQVHRVLKPVRAPRRARARRTPRRAALGARRASALRAAIVRMRARATGGPRDHDVVLGEPGAHVPRLLALHDGRVQVARPPLRAHGPVRLVGQWCRQRGARARRAVLGRAGLDADEGGERVGGGRPALAQARRAEREGPRDDGLDDRAQGGSWLSVAQTHLKSWDWPQRRRQNPRT